MRNATNLSERRKLVRNAQLSTGWALLLLAFAITVFSLQPKSYVMPILILLAWVAVGIALAIQRRRLIKELKTVDSKR
ncbi:hypothetical protein [Mycetocola zhujimingii]|uniref:hypothetical protein n=1 Tax=Mycetocola zhujimingii TaxID=2079792 RepID=UPI000D37704B|nr:hypothetical protein [Mycetocola zhujimingii]AWB86556.1 hypothetical protein C3E77_07965 [Mycetocola zhujimingii]